MFIRSSMQSSTGRIMINRWLVINVPIDHPIKWIINHGWRIMDQNLWGHHPNGEIYGDRLIPRKGVSYLISHGNVIVMILQDHNFINPLSLINNPLSDSPRLWFSIVLSYIYIFLKKKHPLIIPRLDDHMYISVYIYIQYIYMYVFHYVGNIYI
jgi:hypothetical protein